MKPLAEQDHYEILEVSRNASKEAIERAYLLARATYENDSLAGYSVVAEGEAAAIRERIEAAYRVLCDEERRSAYDAELEPVGEPRQVAPAPAAPEPELGNLEDFDEEPGVYDGPRLRRSRLRRGLDLDNIADVTKVSPTYLRFIEEERFTDLPARVYVRGFVTAYASCVGLDPNAVALSYMKRFDEERAAGQRGFVRRR
jgi:curved DNA-binding protein CbpA